MDAVKFIEERNRMCGTMSEVWGVDAAQIVKNTEQWSAAHPRKTRQSVFLGQYPEAQIGVNDILDVCPATIFIRIGWKEEGVETFTRNALIAVVSSGRRRWSDGY